MKSNQGFGIAALVALSIQTVSGALVVQAPDQQRILLDEVHGAKSSHHLQGRFLHITDFHPDAFYKPHSSTGEGSACHSGDGSAGYYGAETSDCDSPIALVNATFDWIAENIKDKIDFIIWTGDSARHDNDERYPRTTSQIRELNRFMVSKFDEVFGRERDDKDPFDVFTVPIVPTFGNNDILPHNIFDIGPNDWTRAYLDIWRDFIPESERHEFDQSGWFTVDVIPGYLTAFSLNTLYFFDKNAAVDGCSVKGEPGYRQMEWLRIQLQFLRERGMKAILTGHVPPARTDGKMNWDETCWQKYALWMRQYRDVIVGTLYGHMNVDHFILQDFADIDPSLDKGYGIEKARAKSKQSGISIRSAASYVSEMRATWALLPKKPKGMKSFADGKAESSTIAGLSDDARPNWEVEAWTKGKKNKGNKHKNAEKERDYLDSIGGKYAERFGLSFVSPSVVPNYYPTLRIYEYNITGVNYRPPTASDKRPKVEYEVGIEKKKKKKDKKKLRKRRRFTVPLPPSKSSPPGPAYSPQSLSLLGYQQYFANLTHINHDFDNMTVSNTDFDESHDFSFENEWQVQGGKWKDGKHGKHNGKKPNKGKGPNPRNFTYEILYDTRDDKIYKLKDLTVRSYVELASRMSRGMKGQTSAKKDEDVGAKKADKKKKKKGKMGKHKKKANKIWHTFLKRAFVATRTDEQIRQEFGN
ncbi:Endopolyphosphatase [Myriangium duriaei CBS 260.36]|uniref:Endopolyphosphatase n=1 Tax=Myriangium duriaei CBS 260.36 TaxID=1168546 RepID=A0A9P4J8X0_9PEZI|nr:Endopolyphosphatase [Myriangium duriaei CBS 260.36]